MKYTFATYERTASFDEAIKCFWKWITNHTKRILSICTQKIYYESKNRTTKMSKKLKSMEKVGIIGRYRRVFEFAESKISHGMSNIFKPFDCPNKHSSVKFGLLAFVIVMFKYLLKNMLNCSTLISLWKMDYQKRIECIHSSIVIFCRTFDAIQLECVFHYIKIWRLWKQHIVSFRYRM